MKSSSTTNSRVLSDLQLVIYVLCLFLFSIARLHAGFPTPPYPVIFIHGINSDASTWASLSSLLVENGWTNGGSPRYVTSTGVVTGISAGNFYTMNMSDYSDNPKSQTLSFQQQGFEVARVVGVVLATNRSKSQVILVAHSMGGLAARSFLQGTAMRNSVSAPYGGQVAELITIGTPHQGSPFADLCAASSICSVLGIRSDSVAVAELRPGSAALNDLNNFSQHPLPGDVIYESIIGTGITWSLASLELGDGLVSESSQNLANLTTFVPQQSKSLFILPSSLACYAGETHTCETGSLLVENELLQEFKGSSGNLDLFITASPDSVRSGDLLTYTLTVANRGGTDMSGVVLRLVVPDYLGFDGVDAIPPISFGNYYSGSQVQWSLGALGAGQTRTVIVPMHCSNSAEDGRQIQLSGLVTADGGLSAGASETVLVDNTPVLVLRMEEDHDPVSAGEQLTYDLFFSNPSSVSALNSVLTVAVPANTSFVSASDGGMVSAGRVQWTLGTLSPGESGRRRVTVQVNNGVGNGTVLTTDAELKDSTDPQHTARATAASSVRASNPLTLAVTASSDPVRSSDHLTYTLTVANRGGTDMSGVVLWLVVPDYLGFDGVDAIPPISFGNYYTGNQVQWSLGALGAGQTRTVIVPMYRSSSAEDGRQIQLSGLVTADGGLSAGASETVLVNNTPVLVLRMEEDHDPVSAGEQLTYDLFFSNPSSVSALNSVLTVAVPANTGFVSASDGGTVSAGRVQWTLGTLSPGEGGRRRVTVQVNNGVGNGTVLTTDAELKDSTDPQHTARATAASSVRASNPLTLAVTASSDPVRSSDHLTYTLTVANRGGTDMSGVVLWLVVPDYLGFDGVDAIPPISFGNYYTGNQVQWSLGALGAGQTRTVIVPMYRSSSAEDGRQIQLSGLVTADGGLSAGASETVLVNNTPVLVLRMEEDHDPVSAGEQLTYDLFFSNPSSVSALNSVLTVAVPANTGFVSASDGGTVSAGRVQWTLGTLSPGESGRRRVTVQVNNGVGNGTVLTTDAELKDSIDPQDTARANIATTIRTGAPLSLSILAVPTVSGPGSNVTYAISVGNRSSVDLAGIVVRALMPDYLSSGTFSAGNTVEWDLDAILAGGSRNFDFPCRISSSSSSGTLVQFAAAVFRPGEGYIAAKEITVRVGNPLISLSGDLSFGSVAVGSSAQRTLTIANTGTLTLTISSVAYPSGFSGNWSSGTIAAGGSQPVTVTFSPTSAATYGGTVTVNSDKTSGVNTTPASGTGTATATRIISLSGDLSFGSVAVGLSAQRTLTIANTGTSTLAVSSVAYPSGFSGNWSSGTIAAGGSQPVTVTFSPTSAATYGGTVTVNSDKTSGVNTTPASGTGTAAATRIISLSGDLSFGSVAVGSSAQRTLTIANTGTSTLTVSSVAYPSGFSGNWPSGTIAAGGSQIATVSFTPTFAAGYGGNITVTSDATSGTSTMAVSGAGLSGTSPPFIITTTALPANAGKVSGGGTLQKIGPRTVKATANNGYIFEDWTENGSVVSTSANYSFTVSANRNLVATFIPNPFVATKGTYNGLFYETNGVEQQHAGFFTIATTTKGTFSGNLQIGGTRSSISGQFDATGTVSKVIKRGNAASLLVNLRLDFSGGGDTISGSVGDGSLWTATLVGDRAVYDGRTSTAPQLGQYTMIVPGNTGSATVPGGDSFGTVAVDRMGKIRLAGSLADGTKISQAVTVSKFGDWPLYIPLYGGRGSILSWLSFGNTGTSDLSGDVVWTKPATSAARYYPDGFSIGASASGSHYTPPPRGYTVLPFSNANLVLSGSDLGLNLTNSIAIGANNRVTSMGANKLSLTFSPSVGTFNGRTLNPATGKPISFSGVVLQTTNIARGFFLGTSQSGGVTIGP
jgi:uncharacterized repeat protein (TIGR01451 family)